MCNQNKVYLYSLLFLRNKPSDGEETLLKKILKTKYNSEY